MPTDYEIEKLPGGGVVVWVSEHDPTDRMKGMVGIVLNPGESIFETRVKLSNITPLRHSFLWWENVAVPSNKNYEIFFPHDVSHVFFHYKRSVTTYPVATNAAGIFNGIRYDGAVDISKHRIRFSLPLILVRHHSMISLAVMIRAGNVGLYTSEIITYHPVRRCLHGLTISCPSLGKMLSQIQMEPIVN